jgi:anti-sigma-K factor RskA
MVRYDRPELRDRLAAEYALGTLHGSARRRFERLLVTNRALRDAVSEWQDRLAPLGEGLEPVAPPPALLARIEKGIGIAPAAAAVAGKAASRAPSRAAPDAPSFWQRLFGMPQLAMMAAGLVLGIGVATLAPMVMHGLGAGGEEAEAHVPASYAGILSDAEGRPTVLVNSRRHGRVADVKVLRPIEVAAGQKLFLWAVPSDGAPFLIGEVPPSGKGSLRLSGTSEQLLSRVTTLGVSKANASETPKPDFILKGPCAKFW